MSQPPLQSLSDPHVFLLASTLASTPNIPALRTLAAARPAVLPPKTTLRLLLTFLPESTDPTTYLPLLHDLATSCAAGDIPTVPIDASSVSALSDSQARRRAKALKLTELAHPAYANGGAAVDGGDEVAQFLVHRAHRVDAETGLLDLVPGLVVPFLGRSEGLRRWFISAVLPLLRLGWEYYPGVSVVGLDEFVGLRGMEAVEGLLGGGGDAARDVRGVVGPWMVGGTLRGEAEEWECLFQWLVRRSKEDLDVVARVVAGWDGPGDMDLGGFDEGREFMGEEARGALELRYAQAVLACLYLVESGEAPALQTAHAMLTRICDLLNCDPPPDLNAAIDALPKCHLSIPLLQDASPSVLREERLLEPDHSLATPGKDSVRVLELIVFSSSTLLGLQHPLSIHELAKMSLRDDYSEQFALLQRLLHTLSARKDSDWSTIRAKLLWLWNWGTDAHDNDRHAQGIFGMLERNTVETEILKALLDGSHYGLAVQTYISPAFGEQPLLQSDVEQVVLTSAMHHYDNASNGNRTRGGMKRAAEIIAMFASHFPRSQRFSRAQALLAATHAMSFYSLILQHGVPFQPVNIRVSSDPLSLIRKLLSQNAGCYTKLDDLISIGQNLVVANPATLLDTTVTTPTLTASTETAKSTAEHRITAMCIDAALDSQDFETAYSYVMTRLSYQTPNDDHTWRAALRAGQYDASAPRAPLRRLEQRMELLSSALLLAPPSQLETVLAVWVECESAMAALLADETEAERRFDDAAQRASLRSGLPGAFDANAGTVQPRRKEMGRAAGEEAPMGLFDVARGAAAAFGRSAGALRGEGERKDTVREEEEERVRKRDMLANTASGALVSGLGWVLGAKPVAE